MTTDQETEQILEVLRKLHEEYVKASKPYLDRLIQMRIQRPSFNMSVEDARKEGLIK
jgi:hypothetical protein